ncbi:MAG: sensor histidine kinase [Candidatus Binatia bacterium]
MVNTILQATQIEAGTVRVVLEDVDLSELLDEIRTAYILPTNKDLTLSWEYSSRTVIETDRERLKHILQHLINNAIKFTDKGQITISARYIAEPRAVEFRVADTGIGIPSEEIPFIFEIFHQGDSSETRPYGGVGLGLYIVKRFTEMLGGKVTVESGLGEGTVFTVTIPVTKSA